MKREHIAFFLFPHAPYINSALTIVTTLLRRGYRVTCVTSERFAPKITSAGAGVILCPPFRNQFIQPSGNDESTEGNDSVGADFVELTLGTLSRVESHFCVDRPQLVIYDFVFLAGRIIATKLGIPAVQTNAGFDFDRNSRDEQDPYSRFWHAEMQDAAILNQLLENHGIRGNYPFHKEQLNIFYYPKIFQRLSSSTDDTFFYAGRCAAEQPYSRAWRPPTDGKRPLVLVSTSTYYIRGPDYFKMCIEAFSTLPWRVVMAIGDNNTPTAFELPDNFEILQHMPQIQALPYCDLLVCLGGMITTVEAMYHAVPLLMITHGFSEPELYADNAVRLGVGRHLRKEETSADRIRSCALEMSRDLTLLSKVREMQHVVRRDPGGEETSNRIIEYLRSSG